MNMLIILILNILFTYNNVFSFPKLELSEDQQIQKQDLKIISGQVPEWLKGIYIYNGPAKYSLQNQKINHWLDGLAMLYKFEFTDRRIIFSNKFINSDVYQNAQINGTLSQSFVELLTKSINQHKAPYYVTNTNIHTLLINDRLVALGETAYPADISINNLSTIGPFLYDGDKSNISQTYHELAHIKTDKEGNSYNLRTNFGLFSYYELYKVPKNTQKRIILFKEYIKKPSYMHDMSLTNNYIIFIASPLKVDPWDLRKINNGYINYFKWDQKGHSTIYIIDKHSGKKILYKQIAPFFTYHHINAYEHNNDIIVDLVTYKNEQIIKKVSNASIDNSFMSRLTIDLKNKKVDFKQDFFESAKGIDLPRINPKYIGLKYQYLYAIDFKHNNEMNNIVKIDLNNNNKISLGQKGEFACEPLFIRNPHAMREDDGVVLSIVYDQKQGNSYFLILNAKNLREIAKALLPYPIPYGLHGNFYQQSHN